MKYMTAVAGFALAFLSSGSSADLLTLEARAMVEEFFPNFEGGDQFPFAGVQMFDDVLISIQYDTELEPVLVDGMLARYELDAAGSFIQLGDNQMSFDSASLRIGTTNTGNGLLSFSGYNTEYGTSTVFAVSGPDAVGMELPTSLSLAQFSFGGLFDVNPDANQLTLPVAFGGISSLAVVPAPGSLLFVGAGVLASARRCRPAAG